MKHAPHGLMSRLGMAEEKIESVSLGRLTETLQTEMQREKKKNRSKNFGAISDDVSHVQLKYSEE